MSMLYVIRSCAHDMATWVEPAFGKSNINHCNLPQMKIIKHLYAMRYKI